MPSIDELMERLSTDVEPADIVELSQVTTEELVELLRSHLVDKAPDVLDFLED